MRVSSFASQRRTILSSPAIEEQIGRLIISSLVDFHRVRGFKYLTVHWRPEKVLAGPLAPCPLLGNPCHVTLAPLGSNKQKVVLGKVKYSMHSNARRHFQSEAPS